MNLTHDQIVQAMTHLFPGQAWSVDGQEVVAWPDGVSPLSGAEIQQGYADALVADEQRKAEAEAKWEALDAAPAQIAGLNEAVDALLLTVLEA